MNKFAILLLGCFLPVTTVASAEAQEKRNVSVFGAITDVLDMQDRVGVSLTLEFGASLPPENESDISTFSRPLEVDVSLKSGQVTLVRKTFDDIPYEINDLFVFGSVADDKSKVQRWIPITRVKMPGSDAEISARTVGTPKSFFNSSFPISQSQRAVLPDDPMPIVRGLRLLISEMEKRGGLDSCQFREIITVIREFKNFFAEGDTLIVKHILDHLKGLNTSLSISRDGGKCGSLTYPEFHAEVLNEILLDVDDRPIRGESLRKRLVANLEDLYSVELFSKSISQADVSLRNANKIEEQELCVRLSTVILRSLSDVETEALMLNRRNVFSILTEVTKCASLVRSENKLGSNSALNNSKALFNFDGGVEVLNRYVEAVKRLNKDQVIDVLENNMRNVRLHFDAFEQQIKRGQG